MKFDKERMIKKFLLFAISIPMLIVVSNCDNPVSDNENEHAIFGKVIDEDGNPVEGVNVHYIPKLVDSDNPGKFLSKPTPTTIIQFSVPENAVIDLVILRYGSRDTITYLIKNEEMQSGYYAIPFNSADTLTNGVYIYVLKYGGNIIEKNLLLLKDPSELVTASPLVRTNNSGDFKLPYNILGIGVTFVKTSESSPEPIGYMMISDSLSLFLVKEGYQNYFEEIKVDTKHPTRKTFRLKRS